MKGKLVDCFMVELWDYVLRCWSTCFTEPRMFDDLIDLMKHAEIELERKHGICVGENHDMSTSDFTTNMELTD